MKQPSGMDAQKNSSELPFGPGTLIFGAGALIAYGVMRRSKAGAAVATAGGLLAFGAAKAMSTAYRSEAEATFLVNAFPQQAYDRWRDFESLPRFMAHLKSVRVLDNNRSEWVVNGPANREIRWTAEIGEDQPNERISWKSLPGSDIQTSGSVEFRPDPQQRGTFVTARVQYSVPGGPLATALAAMMGKHPEFMIREDLRRFKALLVCGEVPTTAGQTHGPRGMHGRVEQVMFRETTNRPEPQAQPELRMTA